MEHLTIGAFAAATRLSPKALRLYDELDLLTPAQVDPVSGYRLYHPDQIDQARLIAWLRRIGMPLARIRHLCALPPAQRPVDLKEYWRQVLDDTAARGQLVDVLVEHLDAHDTAAEPTPTTGIRYAARSVTGVVRTSNEDTVYAGRRLLAVADGVTGPGGRAASAAAIAALTPLDTGRVQDAELLNLLADAAERARHAVRLVAEQTADDRTATTLTAMLWSGSRLALVHIGDCRAYLLRGGELYQITHDHTVVQSLVDEGRLTADEAATHPERSLLMRALTGTAPATPDLSLHTARPDDRYLLCSDGLTTVLDTGLIHTTLRAGGEPEQAVHTLIDAAYAAGAPDNVSAVVADVVAL